MAEVASFGMVLWSHVAFHGRRPQTVLLCPFFCYPIPSIPVKGIARPYSRLGFGSLVELTLLAHISCLRLTALC